jgi:hypothetical protein
MSFQFPHLGMETGKLSLKTGNQSGNSMETTSLKALAHKVLQRNSKGNSTETDSFHEGKPEGVKVSTQGPDRMAYKIYSEILQDHLWVVESASDMHSLRAQGVTEAIYTAQEIAELKGADKEQLQAVHKAKTVFPYSVIINSKKEVKNGNNY